MSEGPVMLHEMPSIPPPVAAVAEPQLRFEPFSALFPGDTPASELADVTAGPLLARGFASAMIRAWEADLSCGRLDLAEPLWVLDLAPGRGRFVWLLEQALADRLRGSPLARLRRCHVVCGPDPAALDAIVRHPRLAPLVAAGVLDSAVWEARPGTPLVPRAQGRALPRTGNPLVAIGLGFWEGLPAELHAVHYGAWMQGRAAVAAVSAERHEIELAYDWRPHTPEPEIAALCNRYLDQLNSAAVMLPRAALQSVSALAALGGQRCLLLGVERGPTTLRQLRLGALGPPQTCDPETWRAPVNLDALGWHLRSLGAWVHQCQLQDAGLTLHAAWLRQGAAPAPDAALLEALSDDLDAAHPEIVLPVYAALNESMPPALMQSLLQLTGDDLRVFDAVLGAWLENPPALRETERTAWRSRLDRLWRHGFPDTEEAPAYRRLALFAWQLDHMALAREILSYCIEHLGDELADYYFLARIEAESGRLEQALDQLAGAMRLDATRAECLVLADELRERRRRWSAFSWYRAEHASAGELTLEPLGPEHAGALCYQYRDPQIAAMTRLSEVSDTAAAQAWIEQIGSDQAACAVMHTRHGLVGQVSARCHQDAAYFLFWVGVDYQGQGLGTQAARLFFGLLAMAGIDHVYTSAYQDNHRSITALGQLGFVRLPVRAEAPDETLLFYYRPNAGNPRATDEAVAGLRALCQGIDSPFVLVDEPRP